MIIGSNFDLSSRLYLDSRQLCDSYADLIENKNNILYPPGFEVYCFKEKTKYYNACENIEDKPVWKEAARGSIAEVFIESDTIPENKDLYWIDTGTVDTLGNQSAHEGIIKELLETVRNLQKKNISFRRESWLRNNFSNNRRLFTISRWNKFTISRRNIFRTIFRRFFE